MKGISLIIPVYNSEKYLHQCLTSITKEMEDFDELILIDDGSKDESYNICRQYEKENVFIIRNDNHGVSYTRNCGIEKATKEYLLFVDADDFLLKGWRTSIQKGIDSKKDIVFFSKDSIDGFTKRDIIKNILFLPTKRKLNIVAGACWYKIFRREYIVNNGIHFNEGLINGEDGIFVLESVLKTASYTITEVPDFYYYRPNDISSTHRYNEKYNKSNLLYISIVEEVLNFYKVFSVEEIKEYINLIHVRGLYILANRIALIADSIERKKQYSLFEQEVYIHLYNSYKPTRDSSKMIRDTFNLLKKRDYDAVIKMINFRRKIYNLIKKIRNYLNKDNRGS